MGVGMKKVRNWGVDAQESALHMAMRRLKLTYKVARDKKGHMLLLFAGHDAAKGITLPFDYAVELVHAKHRRWEALSLHDGRCLGVGISQRDVIRVAMEAGSN